MAISTTYNPHEMKFSEPFAEALVANPEFRAWILAKTRFASLSANARILHEEMRSRRSKVAKTWWGSHFTEKCRCIGCRGQETDVLAVFEAPDKTRFAVHFEVKQPRDTFGARQAEAYPVRASCWSQAPPPSVVPHSSADTALLCSEKKLKAYEQHLPHFGAVVTFEEIDTQFPGWKQADG
jgi:hypothetical protein